MKQRMFNLLIGVLAIALLTSCTHAGVGRRLSEAESSRAPALGTAWGERRDSSLSYVSFERENQSRPDISAVIHYDDRAGIEAQGLRVRDAEAEPLELFDGGIEIGLTDEESGVFTSPYYKGIERDGELYVIGKKGRRYGVLVKNHSDVRVEVVLSVDGLDVMNGRSASYSNRGYIIDPGERVLVEGFRRSEDEVAAFRFSSVEKSYAEKKHGDSSNVGVVGLAVFRESGSATDDLYGRPSRGKRSHRGRREANPFPGEFATAP